MAIRLKSISKKIPWFLLGRALIPTLVWLFLPYWVFILVFSYFYFKSGSRALDLLWMFLVLLGVSVLIKFWLGFVSIGKILVEFNGLTHYSAALVLFIAWLAFFGIKERVFLRRKEFLILLQTIVIFILGLMLFWAALPGDFYPGILAFFVPVFLLFMEFYNFTLNGGAGSRTVIFSVVSSLIISEVAWAISFVSVGIFAEAAILALTWFFLQRFYLIYKENGLQPKVILKNSLAFAILFIFVLVSG